MAFVTPFPCIAKADHCTRPNEDFVFEMALQTLQVTVTDKSNGDQNSRLAAIRTDYYTTQLLVGRCPFTKFIPVCYLPLDYLSDISSRHASKYKYL